MLREAATIAATIFFLALLVRVLEIFIGWSAHLVVSGVLCLFFTVQSYRSLKETWLNELSSR